MDLPSPVTGVLRLRHVAQARRKVDADRLDNCVVVPDVTAR